ncbi:hypothetical protein [Shewanella frigidimarina]|uniref:hypothetical protein n=1 Tax=Shewanella frigidimarina TaxID=56812 RepID=UPI003D7B47C4
MNKQDLDIINKLELLAEVLEPGTVISKDMSISFQYALKRAAKELKSHRANRPALSHTA